MQPLLDADVLVYEAGFACQTGWKEEDPPPFQMAADQLDNRIAHICAMVEATQSPILYLTGKKNFRHEIAKSRPYKDRPGNKPYHYHNLLAYIKGKYDYRIQDGLEADDLLAIEQTKRPDQTIICTRDKDLRQIEGWHYGWEIGNQPSFGPLKVEGYGNLTLIEKPTTRKLKSGEFAVDKSVKGYGIKFFHYQLLTGDPVDSIPGIDGLGAVGAYKTLADAETPKEGLKRVYEAYKASYGMLGYSRMLEQGRLLWMVRTLREDGSPVMWGQSK